MRLHRARLFGSLAVVCLATFVGCGDDDNNESTTASGFSTTLLVANKDSFDAKHVDPNLVNPWGVAFNPTAYAWVANNATKTSTLYDGNGTAQDLVVSIPDGANGKGRPTGIVFNSSDTFAISGTEGGVDESAGGAGGAGGEGGAATGGTATGGTATGGTATGGTATGGTATGGTATGGTGEGGAGGAGGSIGTGTGKAAFMWATKAGTIAAWSPDVDPTKAVNAYDDKDGGASYFGIALGKSGGKDYLYAADFAGGKIDVFDGKFEKQDAADFPFKDPNPPQAGFKPFNVAVIDDIVFVAFAKSQADEAEEVKGDGLGYIDVFELDGTFVKTFTNGDALDAPWAIVKAPSNFGAMSDTVLIGNFGDGKINAYDSDGNFMGALEDGDGNAIVQQGLWGMAFGNGELDQPTNTLFFAAGPNGEADGVYGRIDVNQ